MTVVQLKGFKGLPKNAPAGLRSRMDTMILTPESVADLGRPIFQRELRINKKVQALAEELKHNGGVLPGIVTIGILNGERHLVDGQHRIKAFEISGLLEGYVDIRICEFDTLAEMAEEYFDLNSSLVNMRPDDKLRALEQSSGALQLIRRHCEFVGYDQVRRQLSTSPMLSMSTLLRCWRASAGDVPSNSGAGNGAADLALSLTEEEAKEAVAFLNVAFGAWGREAENGRLWSALNLSICMWLWRRTVIGRYSAKSAQFTARNFGLGLRELAASDDYLEWLVNRGLSERNRTPCYSKIKTMFAARLAKETGTKIILPAPAWAVGK